MSGGIYYVLDDQKRAVPTDADTWARAFEDADKRRVARTDISPKIAVSTVFLGMDHRHFGGGPPLIFETAIFDDEECDVVGRCSTWAGAEDLHEDTVRHARKIYGEIKNG